MKDFVFKCWLCFFGGEKLFCLFICKHLLHSCLMNGAVCALISTNKIGKL